MGIDAFADSYGDWTVLGYRLGPNGSELFCECRCGNRKWVLGKNLRQGRSTCCGCKLRDGRMRKGIDTRKMRRSAQTTSDTGSTPSDTGSEETGNG